jgi:hypothetical protein
MTEAANCAALLCFFSEKFCEHIKLACETFQASRNVIQQSDALLGSTGFSCEGLTLGCVGLALGGS